MTQDFDFFRAGSGDPILFVPGSYSTPAAWRPVQSHLPEGYEFFATSLSGYGQSRERRSQEDISLTPQIDLLSEVMEKIGKPVHLVAHSFGGEGFFDALPENVRAYCTATAKVNALDWHTGMSYRPDAQHLSALDCPITLAYGSNTTAAMKTITRLLGRSLPKARICEIKDAGHFLISTHPKDCASLILDTIRKTKAN